MRARFMGPRVPVGLMALAAAAFVAGCDWVSDGADALEQRYPYDEGTPRDPGVPTDPGATPDPGTPDPGNGTDATGLTCGDAGTVPLAGTWAVEVIQYGKFAPLDTDLPLTITNHFLVDVGQDDASMRWTFCDEILVVDDNGDTDKYVTVIPDALKNAPDAGTPPIALSCLGMPAQQVVWPWGLTSPDQNPLPTADDLAGSRDQDDDGNPGVTFQVEKPVAGMRYLARRVTWNLSAAGENAGEWTGTLTFGIEESNLGADNPVLTLQVPIQPDDARTSTYRIRRTAVADCAALMSSLN